MVSVTGVRRPVPVRLASRRVRMRSLLESVIPEPSAPSTPTRSALRGLVGVVFLGGLAGACTAPFDPSERVELTTPEAWLALPAHLDPERGVRPPDLSCTGWFVEPDTDRLDVHTGTCAHFSAGQPLRAPLGPGTTLRGLLTHTALVSEVQPAQATVEVFLGFELMWVLERPIPWGEASVPIEIPMDRDVAAGTMLGVHVRNHGSNTYLFDPFERVPTD